MGSPVAQFAYVEDRLSIDVFIVSPNVKLRQTLQDKLGHPRWKVIQVGSGTGALELLHQHGVEDGVLLLDPLLPDLEPNEFHRIVKLRCPQIQVFTINSHTGQLLVGGVSPTTLSMRLMDVVNQGGVIRTTPLAAPAVEEPRQFPEEKQNLRGMMGGSDSMQRAFALTRMVALRNTTVLITGESGTGKDLIARQVHEISPRRKQPFVVLNCAAIPESLLEAELFGYTKGAFTGAVQSRIGRIHAAHGGTLFLDEIGDMPVSLQSKLLRFLEQGEVQRLGGNDNLKVDVRVVAATNAYLKQKSAQQQFREDLYYRLAVFPIHLPPLRERMSDLEELAIAFTARFHPGMVLGRDALRILGQHSWPGNVRELRNVIERATILALGCYEITAEHIVL
jgi:DNA-binding NtrC family response regulator